MSTVNGKSIFDNEIKINDIERQLYIWHSIFCIPNYVWKQVFAKFIDRGDCQKYDLVSISDVKMKF